MFAEYLDKAMQHGQIEQIEDGSYFGSIPSFQGVWSNAATEEACRQELRNVLRLDSAPDRRPYTAAYDARL